MLIPASLSLLFIAPTFAWIIPFRVHRPAQLVVNSSDPFTFQNVYNSTAAGRDIYVGNLTVGGRDYEVQLDTGSSDLWLDTTGVDTSSFISTDTNATIGYGDGTIASGPILIGNLTFGEIVVQQAFISAPGTNATTSNDTGLLGLGPGSLSTVESTLESTSFDGKTVLENAFSANGTLGRFITMELSRSFDTGRSSGGIFSVGEIAPQFSNISQSPRLSVINPERWVVVMDGIVVNGNNVSGQTAFPDNVSEPTQTLSNLDSGSSLADIPQFYLDAIYSKVPGAKLTGGVYVVPCDTNIALSFVFGGVAYPVHPIDTIIAVPGDSGDIICLSGFSAASPDSSEDFLLGDTFLRNVYASFNYGKFVQNETTTPFIQLLSTTDAQQASSEFTSLSQKRNASLKGSAGGGGGSSGGGSGGGGGGSGSGAVSMYVGWSPAVILSIASALVGAYGVL